MEPSRSLALGKRLRASVGRAEIPAVSRSIRCTTESFQTDSNAHHIFGNWMYLINSRVRRVCTCDAESAFRDLAFAGRGGLTMIYGDGAD